MVQTRAKTAQRSSGTTPSTRVGPQNAVPPAKNFQAKNQNTSVEHEQKAQGGNPTNETPPIKPLTSVNTNPKLATNPQDAHTTVPKVTTEGQEPKIEGKIVGRIDNSLGAQMRPDKGPQWVDVEFKPTFFTYAEYVVIGDKVAVEFLHRNLYNTNVSKCSKISDLLCNVDNTSTTLVRDIIEFPGYATKALVVVGHEEHRSSSFSPEKFINNLKKIIFKLKEHRLLSIIIGKVIPQKVAYEELVYWRMVNDINAKIHEMCNKYEVNFANLDQAVMLFDKRIAYDENKFYFKKGTNSLRFKLIANSYNADGTLSEMAYKYIANKIDYVIDEESRTSTSAPIVTINAVTAEIDNTAFQEAEKITGNNQKESEDEFTSESTDSYELFDLINSSEENENVIDSASVDPATMNTIRFEVETPSHLRTKPVSSNDSEQGYAEVDDYVDPDAQKEIVTINIPDYMKAKYILFELNGYMLPALVDSGSPFTIINLDVYEKIDKKLDPAEVREVAAASISINGAIGKRPVKVIKNVHCVVRFLNSGLNKIPIWTTIRVVKGFNTPIILGREFLEVYHCKIGFGSRSGLTFLRQPDSKEKIRLPIYHYDKVHKMVVDGTLKDPHFMLRNCRVSYLDANINFIEVTRDSPKYMSALELIKYSYADEEDETEEITVFQGHTFCSSNEYTYFDDPEEPVTIVEVTEDPVEELISSKVDLPQENTPIRVDENPVSKVVKLSTRVYQPVTCESCSDTDEEKEFIDGTDIQMVLTIGEPTISRTMPPDKLAKTNASAHSPQIINKVSNTEPSEEQTDDQRGTLQNKPEDLTYPPEIEDLVQQYQRMLSGKRGTCKLYEHQFVVKPEFQPNLCKHYELPGKKRVEGKPIIDDWLQDGTIKKSDSRYRNPLVGVRKADKTLRICGDYRILNKYLVVRGDQAPTIDSLKTKFGGAKIFSSLDFNESFLQVKLTEDSMKYTAFLFDGTPYEFTRLPFGTKDSMQGFLAAARCALEGTEEFVAAYVDDILVFSRTPEEHKKHLEIVFRKIDAAGMTLKLKKCKFFQDETKFLGFVINGEGIRPDPKKVLPIQNFPVPTCKVDVQSFLGVVNYYRCHIPYCADISYPLARLTGNVEFEWGPREQSAFEKLKSEMCRLLLEAHPDFSRPFYVMTDASKYGIGGFVYQIDDDQNPRIITMVSRLLKAAEINYSVYERELLGLVYVLKKCRYFLDGYEIYAYTDQQPLTSLKNDLGNAHSRIIRWMLFLEEFNIKALNYIPGQDNTVADTLSRYFKDYVCPDSNYYVPMSSVAAPPILTTVNATETSENPTMTISRLTSKNFMKWLKLIPGLQEIDSEIQTTFTTQKTTRVRKDGEFYKLQGRDNKLRIYLPSVVRNELLRYYHENGMHPGINKTITMIKRYFDWPGCREDVEDHLSTCDTCITSKRRKDVPYGEMFHVTATRKNQLLAIDNFGPLPVGRGGMQKILVVMDVFTKYVKLYPVKHADTKSTIRAMEKYIAENGLPETILSDNGSNFTADAWRQHWRRKKVQLRYTSVYRPASNPSERVMQTLAEGIRMQVHDKNQGTWPTLLPSIEQKLNCTEHITTGVAPISLQKMLKPGISGNEQLEKINYQEFQELLAKVEKQTAIKLKQRQAHFHKKHSRTTKLQLGEIVYIKTHRQSKKEDNFAQKLSKKFKGPCVIIKINGKNAYRVQNLDNNVCEDHHINNLKF